MEVNPFNQKRDLVDFCQGYHYFKLFINYILTSGNSIAIMTNEPVCKGLRSKHKDLLMLSEKLEIPVEQVNSLLYILL